MVGQNDGHLFHHLIIRTLLALHKKNSGRAVTRMHRNGM
jgi:hypothetical protein